MKLLVWPMLLALGMVAGCQAEQAPESSRHASTPRISRTPASTHSTEAEPKSPTLALQPCELLSRSDTSALQVAILGPDKVGAARTCKWQRSGHYTLAVAIFDSKTIDQVVSNSPVDRISVRGRAAARGIGPLDTCFIALEAAGSSRVDVVVSADGDQALGCRIARRAAEMVAPTLP